MISRVFIYVLLWAEMLLCGASALNAEELGRLFFSSAERKAMNENPVSAAPKSVVAVTQKENPAPEPKASAEVSKSVRLPALKVTGKVIRSSGNNTIWVNHSPQYKREKN